MADYAKKITERFSNRGPNVGNCAICRTRGPLTKDHVPPKGCGNINDSVISHVYGNSHHPLRETLIQQTGGSEPVRRSFLNDFHQKGRAKLLHVWEPQEQAANRL